MNDDTILIGTRQGWGQQLLFGIQIPELRHHVYVIGKTGSGKTTLLRDWIIQLIALGHGVGFIDPHGDMAEELLNHIPSWRADHLVYFNPADLDFPIGLNLLANVPQDERHLMASGIVGAFKTGFDTGQQHAPPVRENVTPKGANMRERAIQYRFKRGFVRNLQVAKKMLFTSARKNLTQRVSV